MKEEWRKVIRLGIDTRKRGHKKLADNDHTDEIGIDLPQPSLGEIHKE